MKYAVGVDCVQVKRFDQWKSWPEKKLQRIFAAQEIRYAWENEHFFAQRLAVRWAAKEAFLKAAGQLFPEKSLSLFAIVKSVWVEKDAVGRPKLVCTDPFFKVCLVESSLSLTHTRCCATAVVILSL